MPKSIYIAALAVIAWILFSGRKTRAAIVPAANIPNTTNSGSGTSKNTVTPADQVLKSGTIAPAVLVPATSHKMATAETDLGGTYSDNSTGVWIERPVTEFYQGLANDRGLKAIAEIYETNALRIEAETTAAMLKIPVWKVIFDKAVTMVNAAQTDGIFNPSFPDKVLAANHEIYMTNGLYFDAMRAAGNNAIPLWREIYNRAVIRANS